MPGTAFATTLDTLPTPPGADNPGAVVDGRAGRKKAPGPAPIRVQAKEATACFVCPEPANYHSEDCQKYIFCIERFGCFCGKHFAANAMKRLSRRPEAF